MNEWNELLTAELLPTTAMAPDEPLLRSGAVSTCYQRVSTTGRQKGPAGADDLPPAGTAGKDDPKVPPVKIAADGRRKLTAADVTPAELICGQQDGSYYKLRQLLSYEDAPKHLQFNPFIRTGYRTLLSTKLCLESMFWWTNETVNIWSHVFGWFLFLVLSYSDIVFLQMHASVVDKVIVGSLLVCFQVCMVLSSIYHTFSCRSAESYDCFLAYDLFGIALSLLAIFISGIYYAFWCNVQLRNFYIITIGVIFTVAMVLQVPRLQVNSNVKMLAFVAWAAYGVVPTFHWYYVMGGSESTMVQLFIPRVAVMYLLTGVAFLIYVTKVPERWLVGKVDYIGHSHNWWHFFVLAALYYWHNSGLAFAFFMIDNGCVEDRDKCYRL